MSRHLEMKVTEKHRTHLFGSFCLHSFNDSICGGCLGNWGGGGRRGQKRQPLALVSESFSPCLENTFSLQSTPQATPKSQPMTCFLTLSSRPQGAPRYFLATLIPAIRFKWPYVWPAGPGGGYRMGHSEIPTKHLECKRPTSPSASLPKSKPSLEDTAGKEVVGRPDTLLWQPGTGHSTSVQEKVNNKMDAGDDPKASK